MIEHTKPLPKILTATYIALGADIDVFLSDIAEYMYIQDAEITRLEDIVCDLKKEDRK